MSTVLARPLPRRPEPSSGVQHPGLHPAERAGVESGTWFSGLSLELRQAILARARVRHVHRGVLIMRRGSHAADWVGVASGALRLGTDLADGRSFTLDLLGPGDWYGDIELMDRGTTQLDIRAHMNSTLLLVSRQDLTTLVQSTPELHQALLLLDCRRLRHMLRRMEELQTLPLGQRVAQQLLRLCRQFGRGTDEGLHIELTLSQTDLATLLCASRQRINGVLRRMQALGMVQCAHSRITVLDRPRMQQVAEGRELVTSEPLRS